MVLALVHLRYHNDLHQFSAVSLDRESLLTDLRRLLCPAISRSYLSFSYPHVAIVGRLQTSRVN